MQIALNPDRILVGSEAAGLGQGIQHQLAGIWTNPESAFLMLVRDSILLHIAPIGEQTIRVPKTH